MEYQALVVSFPPEQDLSLQQWLHQQWPSDPLLEQAIPWARSIPDIFPRSTRSGFPPYSNSEQPTTSSSTTTKSCRIGLFQFTPCGQYIACVIESDTIAIIDLQQQQQPSSTGWMHTLRSHLQHNIASIAFRPTCPWQLAVGCWTGIALWKKTQLQWLTWKQHVQVECVSWSKDGSLLASFSGLDKSILLWDVGLSQPLVLAKENTLPVCDISFGVCGDAFLFVGYASPRYHFTVYDMLEWKPQRWKRQHKVTSTTPCCKIAWSNCSIAIIASYNQLYALDIAEQDVVWTQCLPDDQDNPHRCIVDIAWDPSAQRLAVLIFYPAQTSPPRGHRTHIALYATQCEPVFRMHFIGWITDGEVWALGISFPPSDCPFGALLAISWNIGTIQLVPLVFAKQP
jgi:hypothetical protein